MKQFGNDDVRNDYERAPSYQIRAFARAILHGDSIHRAWLMEAAEAFIAGKSMPPLARRRATAAD